MNSKSFLRNTIGIMVIGESSQATGTIIGILRDAGYRVKVMVSGDALPSTVKAWEPDLIIIAARIPGMDSLGLCESLEPHGIPVIFTAAFDDPGYKLKAFEAGGVDFIAEPYDHKELLARIRAQLRIRLHSKGLELANRSLAGRIHDHHVSEQILKDENGLLRASILSISDGIICTDGSGMITLINGPAGDLTGWPGDSALGRQLTEVMCIRHFPTPEQGVGPLEGPHAILLSQQGLEIPIAHSSSPIRDADGATKGTVMVFRDVTDEDSKHKEISDLSFHDQLTGLYNRRFFEEELSRLDTARSYPLTILMGDLNGLKLANDAFGHPTGDKLLKGTAQVLKQSFRQEDIICRYGGDEFVVLLPNTGPKETEEIVRRAKVNLSRQKLPNIDLVPSVSFGWDSKTDGEQNMDLILKSAEESMYREKLLESPAVKGDTIQGIIRTLYETSKREEEHSKRVSEFCVLISLNLSLLDYDIEYIRTVGMLHDIGKIILLGNILDKQGMLTEDEWNEIRRHPEVGYRILSALGELSEMAQYVLAHHERWDGKGYPKGLREEEIPMFSRIMSVAEAFDAMTSDRTYRKAMDTDLAIDELKRNSGTQFDPAVVKVFVEEVIQQRN